MTHISLNYLKRKHKQFMPLLAVKFRNWYNSRRPEPITTLDDFCKHIEKLPLQEYKLLWSDFVRNLTENKQRFLATNTFASYKLQWLVKDAPHGTLCWVTSKKGNKCVLKVFLSHEHSELNRVQMREMPICQKIKRNPHPHITKFLDIGVYREIPYMVMEGAAGNLVTYVQKMHQHFKSLKAKSYRDYVLRGFRGLASALEHLEHLKIYHRDIKPQNILYRKPENPEQLMLCDFGGAARSTDAVITQPGRVVGTPTFLSPEQAQGIHTYKGEVYALCKVMLQCLGGKVPKKKSARDMLKHIRTTPPEAYVPKSLKRENAAIYQVLIRGLQLDGDKRSSAKQLKEELEAIITVM